MPTTLTWPSANRQASAQRLGTDQWVLMCDVYGARPSNMGFSETTDFASYKDLGHFNEGVMKTTNFTGPKHGAITYITRDELNAIKDHWKVAGGP